MSRAVAVLALFALAGCTTVETAKLPKTAPPAAAVTIVAATLPPCARPTLEVLAFDQVRICDRSSNLASLLAALRSEQEPPQLRVVAGPQARFIDVAVVVKLLYDAGVTELTWGGREYAI